MKILVGKTFGIGNAVLSIPMIKALCTMGDVTVMVGDTHDDFGAYNVFRTLELSHFRPKNFKGICIVPDINEKFDVAIMSIPFDGRWKNGVHYSADVVIDGRKRPDNVERLGFDMWKKHEVLYQMDNAYEIGYRGVIPSAMFSGRDVCDNNLVYLGIGYKRDAGGFGLSKHLGNEKFAELIRAVHRLKPTVKFVSTGSPADFIQSGLQIMKLINDKNLYEFREKTSIDNVLVSMENCHSYIGNDTGMMHVAASFRMPTHGILLSNDLIRKNCPWNTASECSLLTDSVDDIAEKFVKLVWNQK